MNKVVITGGPCAGKTTCLEVIKQEFAGQVLVVPEVATMLLSGGFPVPGKDLEWSPEWQMVFQTAVLPVQVQLERAYELKAKEKGIELLVCDRGVLDGAAYTPGGLDAFCRNFGLDLQRELNRYSAVIHLESLAIGDPGLYGKANNSDRFEELEQAQKLEFATRAVWNKHPQFHFVSCKGGIEGKIKKVNSIIKNFLGRR